ncbi:hypothetical protein [Streptomyces sp. NPDC089919]|uniref:peptidoglycan-binding domain-containing protein n=1 Tax=Streptomyces sp. NPDC089919 TaxID=3155188 RepID=UPI0034388AA0
MTRWAMRTLRRALVGSMAVIAVFTVSTGTAQAGADNWRTNPELCRSGCSTSAAYISFWQSVLWADNVGGSISLTFIDGQFGPNTEARTQAWQGIHLDWDGKPLAKDGRAGPRTWWSAETTYNKNVCTWDSAGNRLCTFYGTAHSFKWGEVNGSGSDWWFINPRTNARVSLPA